MRVCPRRDDICPHSDACPYIIDQYICLPEEPDSPEVTDLRVELAATRRLMRETHRRALVHRDCSQPHCPICEGSLFQCADCGAAESDAERCVCPGPQQEADALRSILSAVLACPVGASGERLSDRHPTLYGVAWDDILRDPITSAGRLT